MLIGLLIQNPKLYKMIPNKIKNLNNKNILGLNIILKIKKICKKYKKVNTGQILELYRNSKKYYIIKKMSIWNHMIYKKKIKNVFLDLIKNIFKKDLEFKQNFLINKERHKGLTKKEKIKLWKINKKIFKKYKK
ncbi:hypothetical protein RJK70_00215 [Buchnera aphidicola (Pseudoregma panicola)]|uniref:hypothetical protein n=1 Tax=Buchnera aphidicola TaxID=9 RepID=UPI0031B7014B